jgi:hypothetical protein
VAREIPRTRWVVVVIAVGLALLCLAPTAMAGATGSISGTVTGVSPKTAIEGIEVCAFAPEGTSEKCAVTDSGGKYTISGLPEGKYYVDFFAHFQSGLDYVSQYFEEVPTLQEATKVPVVAGSTTPGVDAELEKGAEIPGVVTSAAAGKAAIEGVFVCALLKETGFRSGSCAITDASGKYKIEGLASGEYRIEFIPFLVNSGNYAPQFYDKKALSSEATDVLATAPSLTAPVDAELEEGGYISGHVTDALTNTALGGIAVCAEMTGEGFSGCASTDANGEYTISGLASGKYQVEFFDEESKYVTQYYNGKSSPAQAEEVTVTAPATTPGIDAAMQLVSTLPADTTPPVVSGTPAVGSTLLCANGLWTGIPAPSFTQQWLRDGAPVSGAVGTSYVVGGVDAGHSIACQVTATNVKGHQSATSSTVAIPAPAPAPPPTPVVTVTGSKLSVSGNTTKVHLACARATCAGSVELTESVVVKRRKGKKTVSHRETVVLAKGSYSLAADTSANVTLRLTATGHKRLAHAKHSPVSAQVTVTVAGGSTAGKVFHVT